MFKENPQILTSLVREDSLQIKKECNTTKSIYIYEISSSHITNLHKFQWGGGV